ncbi:MAG: hypothetical protein ACRDA4_08255 [Filifactoraceae bacterium]
MNKKFTKVFFEIDKKAMVVAGAVIIRNVSEDSYTYLMVAYLEEGDKPSDIRYCENDVFHQGSKIEKDENGQYWLTECEVLGTFINPTDDLFTQHHDWEDKYK